MTDDATLLTSAIVDSEQGLLTKKIKGLLNRLSESNLESIFSGIEVLFRTFPRQHVKVALSERILDSISHQVGLLENYIVLYVSLLSLASSSVGSDFLAFFITRLLQTFHKEYEASQTSPSAGDGTLENSKILMNLISFLSYMYIFKLVAVTLLYDLVKRFSAILTEINVELLLKLLKSAGSSLRHDDPTALKDIIMDIQRSSTIDLASSSRLRFMMDMLEDLKNNKKKLVKGDSEFLISWRKSLFGIMRRRNLEQGDPLRIGYEDAVKAGSNAEWIITGYARHSLETEEAMKNKILPDSLRSSKKDKNSSILMTKADDQKMTTSVRRAVFSVLMTSEDCMDAFEKLQNLKLNPKQTREICRVIVHCCGQESTYNPFYCLVADLFIKAGKEHSLTFMYILWDTIKSLKEYSIRRISNLAKFFGYLLAKKSLQFSSLKVVAFEKVKINKSLNFFICILLADAVIESKDPSDLKASLNSLSMKSSLHPLQEGLGFLFRHLIVTSSKLDLTSEKRKLLLDRLEIMIEYLDSLESTNTQPSADASDDPDISDE